MYTIEAAFSKPGRRRRTHSAQFKAQAIASCQPPGISVSAVALSYGINANLLRRWILASKTSPTKESMPRAKQPEFVPLALAQAAAPLSPPSDIRVEVRRGATLVNISWPVQAGADCAAWLRELLR